MSTPVINVVNNVNSSTLKTLFEGVASNPQAADSLSRSDRNIDAVSTSPSAVEGLDSNPAAIRKAICRREGRDPSNFADLDAVVGDQSLREDMLSRKETMNIVRSSINAMSSLVSSSTAMGDAAASPTAMDAIAASGSARGQVLNSSTAFEEVGKVEQAIVKMIVPSGGKDPSNFSQFSDVVSDSSLMTSIAKTTSAMKLVASSSLAMSAVMGSSTSRSVVVSESIAMSQIAATVPGFNALAATPEARGAVESSSTAKSALNIRATSFSESDGGTSENSYASLGALSDPDGVWVKSVSTTGEFGGEHRFLVRGGESQSSGGLFSFDVEHTGNDRGSASVTANSEGEKYRP